jgi:Amt family ammonium transporter
MYQGMFAIITPALISGALAERIRFRSYCLFILLWAIVVYDPLAHWVWALKAAPTATNPDATAPIGWLGDKGSLDFAGGTVVHISAGFSALAAILLLPRRRGYPQHAMHPNSMVLTLTGAGLLWFGWFGFNGGSALGSNALAGLALTTSQVAAATAALTWMIVEWIHRSKPTALGLASGLVAGLVAITPASGWVSPLSALFIGLAAGVVCYTSVCLKPLIKYDDSLDAFGVHGVGGFLGAVLTGVFVSKAVVNDANGNADPVGVLADGYSAQIGVQLLAAAVSAAYAFVATLVLVKFVDVVSGFSLDAKDETIGLDQAAHGEVGFDMSPTIDGATSSVVAHEPRSAAAPPNGKRHFTVVVEGPSTADLMKSWSGLCQAGVAPPPEFRSLYQQMTTVKGNRFRFRGGDPSLTRQQMQRLFQDRLDGAAVQVHIEE